MFEQSLLQSPAARRPWNLGVSIALQCLGIGLAVMIPLLHIEKLRLPDPPPPHVTWAFVPPVAVAVRNQVSTQTQSSALSAPVRARAAFIAPTLSGSHPSAGIELPGDVPASITIDASASSAQFPNAVPLSSALPPAPPRPATPPTQPTPFRVSAGVQAARLIYSPHPLYPSIAVRTRTQGTVHINALIAANGTVQNLHVVSGPPLLINAALDAVRQWRYKPTLLNEAAVEVLTEIDVVFTLNGQ